MKARSDGLCAASCSQDDRLRIRRCTVCDVAITELAVLVVSPTSKRAIPKQRAGVRTSRCDLLISPDTAALGADLVGLTGGLTGPTAACHKGIGTSPPTAELSKHQRLRARLVGLCPCGVLDLCRIVLPPTSEGSILKVCACKSPSSSESLGGSACSEIYGVGVGGFAVCGVAIAELAVSVVSPTLDAVVV